MITPIFAIFMPLSLLSPLFHAFGDAAIDAITFAA
jgi:hypothetical protein